MKKLISLIVLLVTMTVLLCSCGKFECDLCGEEKTGKRYKETVYGTEIVYCKDCKEALEDLIDLYS